MKWSRIHVSPNVNAACISRSVDAAEMGSGKALINVGPYQIPNMVILLNPMIPIVYKYLICLCAETLRPVFCELFYANIIY